MEDEIVEYIIESRRAQYNDNMWYFAEVATNDYNTAKKVLEAKRYLASLKGSVPQYRIVCRSTKILPD